MTEEKESKPSPYPWAMNEKIALRFCVLYFSLLIFPWPLNFIPGTENLFDHYNDIWLKIVPWVGKKLFLVDVEGIDSSKYFFVQTFSALYMALVGTALWSVIDKSRENYQKLHFYFASFVRIYMAFEILTYGFAKIFQSQFPFPDLEQLVEPLGNFSPMQLAWAYMGYSPAYNYFTGGLEVLAGLLLISRKTSMAGTLLYLAIMINVVMMNFCFDIVVKIFSSELTLMGIFMLTPDLPRLNNLFFHNKDAEAIDLYPVEQHKTVKLIQKGLKILILGPCFIYNFMIGYNKANEAHHEGPHPPLYGIYYADDFSKNRKTLEPLKTNCGRWYRLIVQYKNYARLENMCSKKIYMKLNVDSVHKTGTMINSKDSTDIFRFNYSVHIKGHMIMWGIHNFDTITIGFTRVNQDSFLLKKKIFHWE